MRTSLPLLALLAGCGRLSFGDRPSGDAATSDSARCIAPTAGLIGYWPMDTGDVDAVSGGLVRDRSGHDRHGTLDGSLVAVVSAGRVGEALDFAGAVRSYVSLPSVTLDPGAGGATTVALWFYRASGTVTEVIANLPAGIATSRYTLWLNTTNGPPSLCINSGAANCWGAGDATLFDRWVHVVATFVNGRIDMGTFFLDGASAVASCRFGNCAVPRSVGAPVELASSDSQYAWTGALDEVRIYDRALDPDEARLVYECAR